MNVLVACEFSGVVRDAFRKRGHNAWSCDLLPCEGDGQFHLQSDVRHVMQGRAARAWDWDLMIAHPPCTYLCNSGVRWLHVNNSTSDRWYELDKAAEFYRTLRDAPIPRKCIENLIMHRYAMERITLGRRQFVQPWWFGNKAFKSTGLELIGLPDLVPTNKLTPPKKGTDEHKAWSSVHRASPGKDRWLERSRTYTGIAEAMAEQWGCLPNDMLTRSRGKETTNVS